MNRLALDTVMWAARVAIEARASSFRHSISVGTNSKWQRLQRTREMTSTRVKRHLLYDSWE
jgi:hypothetical protein